VYAFTFSLFIVCCLANSLCISDSFAVSLFLSRISIPFAYGLLILHRINSILNAPLDNVMLQGALSALSPVYVRLGGTLADCVRYEQDGVSCKPFSAPTNSTVVGYDEGSGCLSLRRWDAINQFIANAGASLIFGIGAVYGRTKQQCPANTDCKNERDSHSCCQSWTGSWNSTQASHLLSYSISQGYNVFGFEFGNELVGTGGIWAKLPFDQYAADFCLFQQVVQGLYQNNSQGVPMPKLITPDSNFDPEWFSSFLTATYAAGCVPDVVTWHQYLLGAGYDPTVGKKALYPAVLDKQKGNAEAVVAAVSQSIPSGTQTPEIWMGEAGGAFNSGSANVTNRFHSSFWFLDGFGILSQRSHKTFCRQTLIGGNYSLLNTTTYEPNPDYYALLLWKSLMGKDVLLANSSNEYLRAYVHCSSGIASSNPGDVTLLLINLSSINSHQVSLEGLPGGLGLFDINFDQYVMTAKELSSTQTFLNGSPLNADPQTGKIPVLTPVTVNKNTANYIEMPPVTYGFFVLKNVNVSVCSTSV
jgi:heparanase 1